MVPSDPSRRRACPEDVHDVKANARFGWSLPNGEVIENARGKSMFGAEGGIVSEGVAQVFDDLGNPHSHCGV